MTFLLIIGIYLVIGFVLTLLTAFKDPIVLHPIFFIIIMIAWIYFVPAIWLDSGAGRWI